MPLRISACRQDDWVPLCLLGDSDVHRDQPKFKTRRVCFENASGGRDEVALMAADVLDDKETAKIWLRIENRGFLAPALLDCLAIKSGTAAVRLVLKHTA